MPDNKNEPIPLLSDLVKQDKGGIKPAFPNAPKADTKSVKFNPNTSVFEYVTNPTRDSNTDLAWNNQSTMTTLARSGKQFGANFASGFGQGIANLVDVTSWGNDNYQSSLFGVSTKDMQDWANGIAERNNIARLDPGKFDMGDFGWWGEQMASAGTGVGMAFQALAETLVIEAATGGTGTAAALGRLGKLFGNIKKAQGAAALAETFNAAKDLRSAATVYGVMSRTNESRMEAMNSYDEIYQQMSAEKNKDGTPKFTDEKARKLAAEGADVTFMGNMALLPLDILGYRTMVYNPISGAGTGLLERALGKIGNKVIRKSVQGVTFAGLEGTEEGFQFVAQSEGEHYAKVLGGMGDGSSFGSRLGNYVQQDEFWNNFAGGVLGSPIIGGAMSLTNKLISGNRAGKLNNEHKNYVQNIAAMDNKMSVAIQDFIKKGQTKEAEVLLRQFRASKALGALHLDAMTDKDSAFTSHINFLEATLEEVNKGNYSALEDLGFKDPSEEHIKYIQQSFADSIKDAKDLQSIYTSVQNSYNKNFIPQVVNSHFQINRLSEEKVKNESKIAELQGKLQQFGSLSSNGQTLYNAEFELQSLKYEQDRLTAKYRSTENLEEKENINQVLKATEARAIALKEKVEEINKDEFYTKDQRDLDGDILNSALRDPDYSQAMYEKERIDNNLATERKNLSLWNKPEYQKSKVKESIAKAKTKAQVVATEEALVAEDKLDDETKEAVNDKKVELAAQEAAQELRDNQNQQQNNTLTELETKRDEALKNIDEKAAKLDPNHYNYKGQLEQIEADRQRVTAFYNDKITEADNKSKNVIPGNADLFAEESELISGMDEVATPVATDFIPGNAELMSPEVFDFDKSPQAAKDKVEAGIAGLIAKLKSDATFEDLIRLIIKVQGEAVAERLYNAVQWGWEKNGKAKEDYTAIYDKVFANPFDLLLDGAVGLNKAQAAAETEAEMKGAIEEKQSETEKQEGRIVYASTVTNEAAAKVSFITRLSRMMKEVDENGNINLGYEYTEDELHEGDYTDSLQLLDPDNFNKGYELEARIPSNFMEIKIPVYDENSPTGKGDPMTFGAYVALKRLKPTDQEYKDKVPMILYKKSAPNEKGIGFVHDIGWYHPLRFNQDKPEEMAQAIANTRDIRNEVLSGGMAEVTILGKRQTTFAGLKLPIGQEITLAEANPETMLVRGDDSGNLVTSKKNIKFPTDGKRLVRNSPIQKGVVYEVRRYGRDDDGTPTYMAFPVIQRKIGDEALTSILQAINIYAQRSNPDTATRAAHQRVIDNIKASMDLDISTMLGMKAYLQNFMYVLETDNNPKTNEDIEQQAKSKLAEGTPFLAFTATGNIVFGQANTVAFRKGDKDVKSFYINPNSYNTNGIGLEAIKKGITVRENRTVDGVSKTEAKNYPNRFMWYETRVHFNTLAQNKPVVAINRDMSTKTIANTYKEYVMNNVETNIRSVNIGTEDKPNWVTNIQPIITIGLTKNIGVKDATVTEIKNEVLPTEVKPEQVLPEDVQALVEAQRAKAKRILGKDFGRADEDYSPEVLDESQREVVAAEIVRVAGLEPTQQAQVVDFIYNQIVPLVNKNNGAISKAEVNKEVDRVVGEYFTKIKQDLYAEIAFNEKLLVEHPSLANSGLEDDNAGFRQQIAKVNMLMKGLPELKTITQMKVEKETGIKEGKVLVDPQEEENEKTEEELQEAPEEIEQNVRDFWTEVLQENPEHKLSYTMRRFFSQVGNYDAKGNPIMGFMGLPTYTGADTVARNLMLLLADAPADFDSMINKLKEHTKAVPWLTEVIDRLENNATQQEKLQFVTIMSNTPLRMKFTMISYDRKSDTWSTKVYDTHLNGIADGVKKEWMGNLIADSDLVIKDGDGYIVNKERAAYLMGVFESWIGINLPSLEISSNALEAVRGRVKLTEPATFSVNDVDTQMAQYLKTNLVSKTSKMKVSMKGSEYHLSNLGNGKYRMEYAPKHRLTNDTQGKIEVDKWLQDFGINLNPRTIDELFREGLTHNYTRNSFNALFQTGTTNGLFGILYNKLAFFVSKEGETILDEDGINPLQDSVINSLANLEAKYNQSVTPFGFRDNGKSYYALSVPKFATDRVRGLKGENSELREQLKSISFSSPSLWLRLLEDEEFRAKFGIAHIGGNAFKEQGKRIFKENGIANLAEIDHELTKLGMFWDKSQGEISYNAKDRAGDTQTFYTYPGTKILMRMATMFSPTMSDKHMMTVLTTAVLNLEPKDLLDGEGISDDVVKALYDQTVKGELRRMIKYHQNKQTNGKGTNIEAYDKGAAMFLLMPELNNIEYSPGLKLVDAIAKMPFDFTQERLEANEDLMNAFYDNLRNYVATLTTEKLQVWEKSGMLTTTVEDNETKVEMKFFDKAYMEKFSGRSNDKKAKMAAMDFIINNAIAISNSFMLLAGDPAMYYKSKSADPVQQAIDTFVNVGKRLAGQIAPGTVLANSEHEKYRQIFLADRKSLPEIEYLKFTTRVNDGAEITANEIESLEQYYKEIYESPDNKASKTSTDTFKAISAKYPISSGYFSIEGSDAQEYTTWGEHLDILTKLGKTADGLMDITPEEITDARALFASGVPKKNLTEKQLQLIAKVMQPIKPVYTGQVYDAGQDVMRTMYIKSSSFPLIPQLTSGLELDKLRVAMEKMEKKGLKVRASYQTANKVGAINTPAKIWTNEGKINEEALKNLDDSILILDRKNFRIQQEVPFKSGKTGDDKISLGTQLMKLLFGDEIMKYNGFMIDGKPVTGKDLHKLYNDTFINLVKEKKEQLFLELGLDENGKSSDEKKTMAKLQSILKDEAVKRGYPLQDINGLKLNEVKNAVGEVIGSEFNLPLWASANSNRYESMLNSIVANRLIKMKFPGNSFVVGSEEGFRKVEEGDLTAKQKSGIIYTSSWVEGQSSLQASYYDGGKVKKAQVFMGSKFKDAEGKLIDLLTKVDGVYKYITETPTGFRLKEDMFDKELLSMISFRIPTSGHQSASQIEIAGFLPYESADLMIVPRNFTKQKGLDFDVDKENAYQLWNFITDDGKFQILGEEHRSDLLARADKELQRVLRGETPMDRGLKAIFGGESGEYTKEQILESKFLTKLNSKIKEKIMQNKIIQIHNAVFSNPDKAIQSKINKTLNTNYAEDQADMIEGLLAEKEKAARAEAQGVPIENVKNYWTPLSDEYQKQKMISGASGKIGTGAYSLDVVFHSLVQQAAMTDKPLTLVEYIAGEDGKPLEVPKFWQFGKTVPSEENAGKLGMAMTIDGSRSISEVMAERQNIAVDNEKLQIMGRVNLNDITMDVDKVMNMLGYDKGEDGNSISFLFLSQPIIKEFVARMKNSSANVATYERDKEQKIIDALLYEYHPEANDEVIDEDYWKVMSARMTNKEFIENIKSAPDGVFQAAVLRRFAEMRKYGLSIRSIQTTINTDSKGLGKSFFDVIEKRNALNNLGKSQSIKDGTGVTVGGITGVTGLLGEYIPMTEVDLIEEERLTKLGYVNIGNNMVLPTTLSGGFNIYGVSTAYNLWNEHFPYDSKIAEKAFSEVMSIIATGNVSEKRAVEIKQKVFQGIKKFTAINQTGIVSITDDLNEERKRLFIDSDTNTSLARYMKTLLNTEGNTVIDKFIKSNNLINRFEFDVQKNGSPSLIKYNNAAGEEFNEQYLYESFATLIEMRGKTGSVQLPKIGNKEYTLDTLAQDLIAYCYLGNAVQEAIQFTKYVPVSYLNTIGYSKLMRDTGKWLNSSPAVLGIKNHADTVRPEDRHNVSDFTMQFIQHNPERVAYKEDTKSLAKKSIKNDDGTFVLKGDERPIFIAEYDNSKKNKGEKKFNLYWFDGAKYIKIPVLGRFGMDEYQPGINIGKSIVNGQPKAKQMVSTTAVRGTVTTDKDNESMSVFSIDSKNLNTIVTAIAQSNSPYAKLAETLAPFALDEIKIVIADDMTGYGKHNKNTNTITINSKIIGDPNLLAQTVLHEFVHALTTNAIDPYIIEGLANEVTVSPDAPAYVSALVRLFNKLRIGIDSGKLTELEGKLQSGTALTAEFKSKYYGYRNIREFISMAITDKGFQDILNNIPYEQSGMSFLERFKQIIADVLASIGVKFNKDFTAANAISIIFETIEQSNIKRGENPYEGFLDMEDGNSSLIDEADDLLPETRDPLELINLARKAMLKDLPKYLKAPYLANIEGGLKEIAAQLNSTPSEAKTAKSLYGETLSKIALELYPNENKDVQKVSEYIKNLDSKDVKC